MIEITTFNFNKFTTINKDLITNHFDNYDIIAKEYLQKLLPDELLTKSALVDFNRLNDAVSEVMLVKFLELQLNNGNYVGIDYLIHYYKLHIVNNMIIFNERFTYKNINKTALIFWFNLNILRSDKFIVKYLNTSKLHYVTRCINGVHNLYFPDLDISCNINNSMYIKAYTDKFTKKILNALLKDPIVCIDYSKLLFQNTLNDKLKQVKIRRMDEIIIRNKYQSMLALEQNDDILMQYNKSKSYARSDAKLILDIKDIINIQETSSQMFITLFNIKNKCMKSKNIAIIDFTDIANVLSINNHTEVTNFKEFLRTETSIIDNNLIENKNIKITWCELSEIISKYVTDVVTKNTLELYCREVNKNYETIAELLSLDIFMQDNDLESEFEMIDIDVMEKYINKYR